MKHLINLSLLCATMAFTLSSCASSMLYGTYNIRNVAETTRDYNVVWNDVIDFFANSGIPISTLEKESGLIVAKGIAFGSDKITMESNTTYEPMSKSAYIVIPHASSLSNASATADFNVRVRNDGNRVVITINVLNINAQRSSVNPLTLRTAMESVPAKSTGVFERQLLNLFR
ncbi:MAG: hypothetical protein NC324_09115 [Bacteroides sp.]|nr:hypothetical protein [Bacteroides sp.]